MAETGYKALAEWCYTCDHWWRTSGNYGTCSGSSCKSHSYGSNDCCNWTKGSLAAFKHNIDDWHGYTSCGCSACNKPFEPILLK